jgi:hypothetical protein
MVIKHSRDTCYGLRDIGTERLVSVLIILIVVKHNVCSCKRIQDITFMESYKGFPCQIQSSVKFGSSCARGGLCK